jgi:hypothetical protein
MAGQQGAVGGREAAKRYLEADPLALLRERHGNHAALLELARDIGREVGDGRANLLIAPDVGDRQLVVRIDLQGQQ